MDNRSFVAVMGVLGVGTGCVITTQWSAMLIIATVALYIAERRACLAFLATTGIVAWMKFLYF